MTITPPSEVPLAIRLWARVQPFDVRDSSACADFMGHRTPAGYGTLHDPETGQQVYAHRAMWSEVHKQEIPDGHVIHHTCARPSCVRPGHLECVTTAEHGPMAVHSGRARVLPPLNNADAMAMRTMYATGRWSQGDISRLFFDGSGAGQPAVQRVVTGQTYKKAGGPIVTRGRGTRPKRRRR